MKKNRSIMPPSQRTMESVAEIAYICGEFNYTSEDSRADIANFLQWAEEFQMTRKVDGDGNETYTGQRDYISAIWDFTRRKINQSQGYDRGQSLPIPPDPEGVNNDRADWALVALEAFEQRTGADREDSLQDLLCDLMHWCDRNDTNFSRELRRARGMYEDETLIDDDEGEEEPATRAEVLIDPNAPAPYTPPPQPPEDVPF